MNVTRAVLPVMRKQRSGHIISISSSASLSDFEFGTAYAGSKFGLEGWSQKPPSVQVAMGMSGGGGVSRARLARPCLDSERHS